MLKNEDKVLIQKGVGKGRILIRFNNSLFDQKFVPNNFRSDSQMIITTPFNFKDNNTVISQLQLMRQ